MCFYGNVKELIPPNAPKPLGLPVIMCIFMDLDHAGDAVTRQSHTGYAKFLNNAVVNWYSKMQGSIEGATFGGVHGHEDCCQSQLELLLQALNDGCTSQWANLHIWGQYVHPTQCWKS